MMNPLWRPVIYALYVFLIAWLTVFFLSSHIFTNWIEADGGKIKGSFCGQKIPVSALEVKVPSLLGNFSTDTECIQRRINGTGKKLDFCVFPAEFDKYISVSIRDSGVWDPPMTEIYVRILRAYPHALVVDIGANIGYFTLLACTNGNRVLSVEPALENVALLSKAVFLNRCQKDVKVFRAAAFDCHCQVHLSRSADNQGGRRIIPPGCRTGSSDTAVQTLLLKDLIPFTKGYAHAIIKIDIEGYECRVLEDLQHWVQHLHTPYLFVEWRKMSRSWPTLFTPCSRAQIRRVVQTLQHLHYTPLDVKTGNLLDFRQAPETWQVGDVLWRHKDAKLLLL